MTFGFASRQLFELLTEFPAAPAAPVVKLPHSAGAQRPAPALGTKYKVQSTSVIEIGDLDD